MEIKNVLTQYRQGKLDVDFDSQDIYEVLYVDGVHYKYYIAHQVNGVMIGGENVYLSFPMKYHYQCIYNEYDAGLITYQDLSSQVVFNEINDVYDYDFPVIVTVGSKEFEVLDHVETSLLLMQLKFKGMESECQQLNITCKNGESYLHVRALEEFLF